ncbi:putative lipoprotein [Bacillus cereus]|nr:putative lipoprotein [Bacillus cereus]
MFRKVKGILVGVLCVAVVSGCGTKVSDVALVSDIGGHTVEAKAEVQDTISLVDGRTGTEVKKLDLSGLGYFEDEAKFKKVCNKGCW